MTTCVNENNENITSTGDDEQEILIMEDLVKRKKNALNSLGDFFLPFPESSVNFYMEMQKYLSVPLEYKQDSWASEKIESIGDIPFFPIPIISLAGVFKQYNFKEFGVSRKRVRLASRISIEDKILMAPKDALVEKIKNMIGQSFSEIVVCLQKAFKLHPIWSVAQIENECKKKYSSIFKTCKWSMAKNALCVIGYTYTTGPWKKLWIRYGYDPRKDPDSFRYQVYVWKNISKAFMIRDNSEIFEKIISTPEYRSKKFDSVQGFLTKQALTYIHGKMSQINMPEQKVNEADILGDLVFDTLD